MWSQLAAAKSLGYQESHWPKPVKPEAKWPGWDTATTEERSAWVKLGMDDADWPPGSGIIDGDARYRDWVNLTQAEKAAAELLDWTNQSWTEQRSSDEP